MFNFIIEIFLATNFDLKQQRHFRLTDFTGMKSVITGKKKVLVMPALWSSFLLSIMNYATYLFQTVPVVRMCRLNKRYEKFFFFVPFIHIPWIHTGLQNP